jgi:hypothetical protein
MIEAGLLTKPPARFRLLLAVQVMQTMSTNWQMYLLSLENNMVMIRTMLMCTRARDRAANHLGDPC